MDMKKYLLLFILLLTGCKATYNLDISDDKIIESSNFYRESSDADYYVDEDGLKIEDELFNLNDMLDSYYNKDYYAFNYNADSDAFYTKSKIDDVNGIGINLNYSYNYDIFKDSYLFSYCSSSGSFVNNDKYIVINVSGLDVFFNQESIGDFNSLTINIKTNLKVIKNNADSVNRNIYTWNINKKNSEKKRIYIKVKKKVDYTPIIIVIIFVTCILLFIIFMILFIRKKNIENNSI